MTKLNWKDEITLAVELAYEAHPYPKDYQYKGDEYKRDEVIKDVTDQILDAFKAHVEKCEKPENPYLREAEKTYFRRVPGSNVVRSLDAGFLKGVEADRKKLLRSL